MGFSIVVKYTCKIYHFNHFVVYKFSSIKYIHSKVVQSHCYPFSEFFHYPKQKLPIQQFPIYPSLSFYCTCYLYEFAYSKKITPMKVELCSVYFVGYNILKVHPYCSTHQDFLHFKG